MYENIDIISIGAVSNLILLILYTFHQKDTVIQDGGGAMKVYTDTGRMVREGYTDTEKWVKRRIYIYILIQEVGVDRIY